MKENSKKMSAKELETVSGGTCYSGDTFDEKGMTYNTQAGQKGNYHPVIVTVLNKLDCRYANYCVGTQRHVCGDCANSRNNTSSGPGVYFCTCRSREVDTH